MCDLKIIKGALAATGHTEAEAVAAELAGLTDPRRAIQDHVRRDIIDTCRVRLSNIDTQPMTPLNRMVIASAIDALLPHQFPAAESA